MKRLQSTLLLWLSVVALHAQYAPDLLGDNFEQRTFEAITSGDTVRSTLVRRVPLQHQERAVLYVHGYNDYFFQEEMAAIFADSLYNFYAIDLRKYGRSLRSGDTPFQVNSLYEYFADIDSALHVMRAEGNEHIILMGHSTGGLTASLYCHHYRHALPVEGLILNSPFLDMNLGGWFMERVAIPIVSWIGSFAPNMELSQSTSTAYAESLLAAYHGEWVYDTDKKMLLSPPYTVGWIRAIHKGHKELQRGLQIPCPILLLYSDKTIEGDIWTPAHQTGDAVLDVVDIATYGAELGSDVTSVEIVDGLHDLVLSSPAVRTVVYSTIFNWLSAISL